MCCYQESLALNRRGERKGDRRGSHGVRVRMLAVALFVSPHDADGWGFLRRSLVPDAHKSWQQRGTAGDASVPSPRLPNPRPYGIFLIRFLRLIIFHDENWFSHSECGVEFRVTYGESPVFYLFTFTCNTLSQPA